MIEIQPRDRKLIDLIYEQQFMSVEQAHGVVFHGMVPRLRRRRIAELTHAGFIRFEPSPMDPQSRIIRLSKSGIQLAESGRAERIPQLRRISVERLLHDSMVTAVRSRLAELWNATWIPERLIQSRGDVLHAPDGVLVFPSGTTIAIEVENAPLNARRFRDQLESWRGTKVLLVVCIASSEALFRTLQARIKNGPKGLPFALLNWKQLESGVPRAWTMMGELDLFARREL